MLSVAAQSVRQKKGKGLHINNKYRWYYLDVGHPTDSDIYNNAAAICCSEMMV